MNGNSATYRCLFRTHSIDSVNPLTVCQTFLSKYVCVAYVILGVNIAQIDLKMTRGAGSSRREREGVGKSNNATADMVAKRR